MKSKKMTFHKNKLMTCCVLFVSLLILVALFFLGHVDKNAIESCTATVKSIENETISVQVSTGKYLGQTFEIQLKPSESIPPEGATIALQIANNHGNLMAYVVNGYATYESAIVTEVLSDSCTQDPLAENTYRGEQTLSVHIKSGQYTGMDFMVVNAVGPIYNQPMKVGDHVSVILSTDFDGSIRGSIYEYNRTTAVYIILGLFVLFTLLVGGKTGAKSLLGLMITLISLLFILLPLLLKGYPTLITTFVICATVALLSLLLLGGIQEKTICAFLGTVSGMIFAIIFAAIVGKLARIDGLRLEYAEALLQLKQTGASTVGIKNIVTAGVMISALGAVMDVAMSISSSMTELNRVNPNLTHRQLWTSGMQIGRDMVGTMTNTLVLAIFGSSLMLIIYLYSLDLSIHQFMSSSYLSLELISSIASSIGIILSVPLTVTICVLVLKKKNQAS